MPPDEPIPLQPGQLGEMPQTSLPGSKLALASIMLGVLFALLLLMSLALTLTGIAPRNSGQLGVVDVTLTCLLAACVCVWFIELVRLNRHLLRLRSFRVVLAGFSSFGVALIGYLCLAILPQNVGVALFVVSTVLGGIGCLLLIIGLFTFALGALHDGYRRADEAFHQATSVPPSDG